MTKWGIINFIVITFLTIATISNLLKANYLQGLTNLFFVSGFIFSILDRHIKTTDSYFLLSILFFLLGGIALVFNLFS